MMRGRLAGSLGAVALVASGHAYLRVSALFGDNMVLQAGSATPIYGVAAPNQRVHVIVGAEQAYAIADENGRWKAVLNLRPGAHSTEVEIATGVDRIVLHNVLIGEVWICAGQSNMEWSYHEAKMASQDIDLGNTRRPRLRLFKVRKATSGTPREEAQGRWVVCSPTAVNDFSMLGYLFGADLQDRMGAAVGMIESDWGGTPAEAWAPASAIDKVTNLEVSPQPIPAGAESAGKPKPERAPTVLYNAMIHPLMAFGFKGVAWYQGESNVGRAAQYRSLFPKVITSWREAAQRDFTFIFVQLANFASPSDSGRADWAELRQAQASALCLPNTGMATAADLSHDGTVHNIKREELAKRLAWVALGKAYDRKSEYSGPTLSSLTIEGTQARIEFASTVNGLLSRHAEGIAGFEIAGEDRVWHKAYARIYRGAVIVYSPKVPQPVAVRYGWGNDPELSLYNSAGLPALPFRTDDWGN